MTRSSDYNDSWFAVRFTRWLLTLAVVASASVFPARAQTIVASSLWNIPAGSRDYMTTGTTERGVAINPVTGHVLIVSRAGGLNVVIVDGETGEDIGRLDTTDIAGGTFALSTIGVAEDGAIYAANLVTAAGETSPFKIYRWENEGALPTVAYAGAPSAGMRFGDSLDVRGAGAATQIAAGSSGTATAVRFAVFTTTDGQNFVANVFSPAGVAANNMQKGIAFGPTNTVYGAANGAPVRHVSYTLATGASALIRSSTLASSSISPVVADPVNGVLVGVGVVAPNAHQLLIYDFADPAAPSLAQTFVFPDPLTANGNGVGAVDAYNGKLVALDTQSGLLAVRYVLDPTPVAPTITSQPVGASVLEGGAVTFTASARGTKPFTYLWYFNETNLVQSGASASLSLTASSANAGAYRVVVTNSVGSAQSDSVTLVVTPVVRSGRLAQVWQIAPGARPYVANDNNQRGMAYNPVSGNVLLVSRSLGSTNIYVLDGQTGAEKHRLRSTDADGVNLLVGGTFVVNMVGVADDGAVYVCNLGNTTTGADFKIYRWANDGPDTVPTVAYGPENPGLGGRCGDTFDVRGAGAGTQLLIGSRSARTAAVFTSPDGETFVPTVILVPDVADGNFGLGVAFGPGNTFFGKANGAAFPLRHVEFNLDTGEGTTLATFGDAAVSSAVAAIGYDPVGKFLAGVSIETPDNVRLYGATNLTEAPVLLHQEFFPTDNANINGTGAIDFGSGRLFALDSNNGLVAYRIVEPSQEPPVLSYQRQANGLLLSWPNGTLQSAQQVNGPWESLPNARSPYPVSFEGASRVFWRVVVP